MSTFTRALFTLFGSALLLGGCLQPVGDLGRRDTGFISRTLDPALERLIVLQSRGIANRLDHTDDEKEMSNRLWRFLTLPHTREWIYPAKAAVHRVAYLMERPYLPPEDRYYKNMKARQFKSSRAPYRALQADVNADLATLPPLFQVICRTRELDRRRGIALHSFSELEGEVREEVEARLRENQLIVDHFVLMTNYRYQSYSYALKRLLVESPHEEARQVDAALSDLASLNLIAERGEFCTRSSGMESEYRQVILLG